ncbi:MAG: hypothetical protein KJZ86_12550 [Caldilineaceae bacterium]|nr:hypothetical protein [Caldilineaceae bacterium]HRJ40394.1 hypothetical protein [Caldilineaceae bacterium]
MGFARFFSYRRSAGLLILTGLLALCTVVLLAPAAHPQAVAAQISPLSPLTVATPLPQSQPQVLPTDTPSPLPPPQAESGPSSSAAQSSSGERTPQQSLIPLGNPAQVQPSLILVGALLAGLVVLVIVVLVARRRE